MLQTTRKRIESVTFHDAECRFWSKGSRYLRQPASSCGYIITSVEDDTVIKWFLLLYSISIAFDLFKEKILSQVDKDIYSRWRSKGGQCIFMYEVSTHLVDDVIDLDAIMDNPRLHLSEREEIQQGICLFLLTAGYNYLHNDEFIPDELHDRIQDKNVRVSTILACSQYISMITGKDFFLSFNNIMDENGLGGLFDDLIVMVNKNVAISHLKSEIIDLERKISEYKESIRRQETAGEIIAQSFGTGIAIDVLDARIKKCNNLRDYLYELESGYGSRLSFLDPLSKISDSSCLNEFLVKHIIFLSDIERNQILTIENLIDTMQIHKRFITDFSTAFITGSCIEEDIDDNPYDLESRIREVELVQGISIDRDKVLSLNDLLQFVSTKNSVLKQIGGILIDELGVSTEDVTLDANLVDDLGADSLDIEMLQMKAENEFNIKFTDEESFAIRTVRDIYETVQAKLKS